MLTYSGFSFLRLPGRNRNLQGLAVAIVKLWEKCELAKIAVKRGVQNTNSELMAEELKVADLLLEVSNYLWLCLRTIRNYTRRSPI